MWHPERQREKRPLPPPDNRGDRSSSSDTINAKKPLRKISRVSPGPPETNEAVFRQWVAAHKGFVRSEEPIVKELMQYIKDKTRQKILENMGCNSNLIDNAIKDLIDIKAAYDNIRQFRNLRSYLVNKGIEIDPGRPIAMFDSINESVNKNEKIKIIWRKLLINAYQVEKMRGAEESTSKTQEIELPAEVKMLLEPTSFLSSGADQQVSRRLFQDFLRAKFKEYNQIDWEIQKLSFQISKLQNKLPEEELLPNQYDDLDTKLPQEGQKERQFEDVLRREMRQKERQFEDVSGRQRELENFLGSCSRRYVDSYNESLRHNRGDLSVSINNNFDRSENTLRTNKEIGEKIYEFDQIYMNAKDDPATELIWDNRERFQILSKSDKNIHEFLLDYYAYLLQKEEVGNYLDSIKSKSKKNDLTEDEMDKILHKDLQRYTEFQLLWEKLYSQSLEVKERVEGSLEKAVKMDKIGLEGRSEEYSEWDHYPNQDASISLPEQHAYAVFDGLGGRKDGDLASSTAKYVFKAEMEEFDDKVKNAIKNGKSIEKSAEELMGNIVNKINDGILYKTIGIYQNKEMPMTTMTALKIVETENKENKEKIAVIANVGDSRCYRIRINGEKPTIEQLTLDNVTSENLNNENAKKLQKLMAGLETFEHGYLEQRLLEFRELIDIEYEKNEIAIEDAKFLRRWGIKKERPEMSDDDLVLSGVKRRIKKRHKVHQALGNAEGIKDPAVYTYKVEPGDIYVLSTDGVHDTLTDEQTLQCLTTRIENPKKKGEYIVVNKFQFSTKANEAAEALVFEAFFKACDDQAKPDTRGKVDDITVNIVFTEDKHNIKDNSELITASSSYSHNEIDKIADRLKDKLRVAENSKVIDAVDQFICKNIDIVVHNSSNSHSNSPDDLQEVSYLEQFQTYLKEIRDEASEAQIMVNLREMKKGVDARPLDRKGSVIDTAWKGLLNGWTVEQMNKYVENQAYIEEIIKNIKANPQAIETVKEFIDGRIVILRNSNSDNDQEDTRYLKEINTNLDKIKNDASEEQVMNVLMAMKKEVDARPLGWKAIMTEVALEGLLAASTRDEVEEDMEGQMEIYDVIKNIKENSQLIGTIQDYIKQVLDMSQFKDQEDSDYLNNFKTDLEEIRNETSEEQRVVKLREMKNKVDTRPPDWKGSMMERAWLGLLHGWQNDVEVYIEEQVDISCINKNIKENPQVIETVQSFINKQIDTLRKDNVKSDDISYLEMFNDNLEEIGNEVSEKQIMGILMTMKDVVDIKSIKTVRFAIGAAWEGLLKDPTTTVKQMEEYMYELIDIDDINENIKENPQLIETVQEYINILLGELSFVDEGDRRCLEEFNARLGEIGNETIDEERMLDLRFMKNEFDAEFDAEFIDWKVLVFKKAWGGLIDNWTPNQMNEDIDEQKNIYEIINTINENPQVIENVQRFIEEHRENVQRFIEERRDTLVERNVSSQKSRAHPLENLGLKGLDKSSTADLPRNIEKTQRNDPNSSDEVTSDDLEYGEYLGQFNTCLRTIKESIEEENSIFGVIIDEMRDQTYKKRIMGNLMAMKNEVDDSSLEAKEFVIEAAWEGLQNAWTVEEMDKYMDMQLDMHDIIEKINEENSQVIETVQQFIGEHRDTLVGKNDSNFPDNVISDDLENIGYLKQFNNCLNEIRDTKSKVEEGKIEKEVAEEEIMNKLMTMKKEFDDKYLESEEFVIQAAWEGLKGKMGLNEMKKYVSDQMEVVKEEEEEEGDGDEYSDMETN